MDVEYRVEMLGPTDTWSTLIVKKTEQDAINEKRGFSSWAKGRKLCGLKDLRIVKIATEILPE